MKTRDFKLEHLVVEYDLGRQVIFTVKGTGQKLVALQSDKGWKVRLDDKIYDWRKCEFVDPQEANHDNSMKWYRYENIFKVCDNIIDSVVVYRLIRQSSNHHDIMVNLTKERSML